MNYMTKVAEMLGVELGERFKIILNDGGEAPEMPVYFTYQFDSFGLICSYDGINCQTTLNHILDGTYKIVKLPWKPKDDEECYIVTNDGSIVPVDWDGSAVDIALYAFGNCFRTAAEAEAHKDEILAKMKEVLEG